MLLGHSTLHAEERVYRDLFPLSSWPIFTWASSRLVAIATVSNVPLVAWDSSAPKTNEGHLLVGFSFRYAQCQACSNI